MNPLKNFSAVTVFLFALCCLFSQQVVAQQKSISYNVVNNELNEGVEIPAEEMFSINGLLPEDVEMVRLNVHKGKIRNNSDQSSVWRLPFDFPVTHYDLPIDSPLRSNQEYLFEFFFYKKATEAQIRILQQSLHNNVESYINANYEVTGNSFSSMSAKQVIKNNLNQIVIDGASSFEHYIANPFPGFSDIVTLKIDKLQQDRMKNARFNIFKLGKSDQANKVAYANALLSEMKSLVKDEIDQYLSESMLVLADVREVKAVTEQTYTYLPVNFGYGGAYFGGGTNDMDYGSSPFLGLSFMIGNRTFSKYLGKASISTGLILQNMENNDGETVSGLIFGRPVYMALGYSVLKIMRLNIGATLTATEKMDKSGDVHEQLHIYPFVGISIEMNVWAGFNRKR